MTSRARPMICSFWKMGLVMSWKIPHRHGMRLDGEDAGVQDAALVADVVAHDILARFEHAAEQMEKGITASRALPSRSFDCSHRRRRDAQNSIALDDLQISSTITTADGIFCSSALAFFCASLRV
jgi:hypothetical protein